MTTLEEISNSVEDNFNFWSAEARFKLALYRENKRKQGTKHFPETYRAATIGYRKAFKKVMQYRRNQTYLNDNLKG
jgi:hypothetical protein